MITEETGLERGRGREKRALSRGAISSLFSSAVSSRLRNVNIFSYAATVGLFLRAFAEEKADRHRRATVRTRAERAEGGGGGGEGERERISFYSLCGGG